ncbi:MAG: HAD-IA family hydrolase, partial [Fulvivirga sp.]|nr:HAD-IA family hydrolase [Fulvivirga sp.]
VDTEITAAEVVVKKLGRHGVDITVAHYLNTYTGSTFSKTFAALLNNITSTERDQLVLTCEKQVYESLKPIEGMASLVKSLQLPVAVVSNSYVWQIEKALKLLDLNNTINHIFSAEMVANPKPAPDVYLLAAQKCDVAPEACLVVEDSKSGVKSAVSAGMQVIGFCGGSHIRPGHDEELKKLGAKYVTQDANTLLLMIQKILRG